MSAGFRRRTCCAIRYLLHSHLSRHDSAHPILRLTHRRLQTVRYMRRGAVSRLASVRPSKAQLRPGWRRIAYSRGHTGTGRTVIAWKMRAAARRRNRTARIGRSTSLVAAAAAAAADVAALCCSSSALLRQ
jgi:hypothetical protein